VSTTPSDPNQPGVPQGQTPPPPPPPAAQGGPYQPQPGAPVPPPAGAPAGPYPQGGAPYQPAPAKKERPAWVRTVLGIVAALVVFALVRMVPSILSANGAPKVGECVKAKGSNAIEVVKCDDKTAEYKVVGIVENQKQADFDADRSCTAYPTADASYWEGRGKGGNATGWVACLEPLK